EPGANLRRADAFRYDAEDRFPVDDGVGPEVAATVSESGRSALEAPNPRLGAGNPERDDALGLVAGATVRSTADLVADELVRLIGHATVRDKTTGVRRTARPADVAILFRSRESHRAFAAALERH